MITHGDNFRLVTGAEAEASFSAWLALWLMWCQL